LDPVTYELGNLRDAFAVDKSHRARLDAGCCDRRRVHVGDSVDDRVPDAHDVGFSPTRLLVRGTKGKAA
jgi:hypothetical protein